MCIGKYYEKKTKQESVKKELKNIKVKSQNIEIRIIAKCNDNVVE